MGITSREARQELAKKGLMAVEEMSEEQMIIEGLRLPLYEAPDFSKIQEEREYLYLVKTKGFKKDHVKTYVTSDCYKPELMLDTFRPNGEKRTKGQKEFCKIAARLRVHNVEIRKTN